jgi:NTE family protein
MSTSATSTQKIADDVLVDLALQGGGAHGAFTWGVLDRLLEEPRLGIDGISGTSAGAMNAAVLADGYTDGGAKGARRALEAFWAAFGPQPRRPVCAEHLSPHVLFSQEIEHGAQLRAVRRAGA